jgi:hypothetical protein
VIAAFGTPGWTQKFSASLPTTGRSLPVPGN